MKKFIILITIIFTFSLTMIGCSNTSTDSPPQPNNDNITSSDNSSQENVVATIYTSDFQAESLLDNEVTLKELTPDSLFNELKTLNVIPTDTKLNTFNTSNKDNTVIGVADFSEEFYNFNLGSSGEVLMLNSIAKTYIKNFNLDKFKILVDGEEYESGHILFEKNDYFTLDSID
ncbi:MAG: GerMN domain-containing protein [Peptostreptococcaceae bacterium]